MNVFCSIRMVMHQTILLNVFNRLVKNLKLGRQFGFSTVDGKQAQFHISSFEKLPVLQQPKGETVLANHKLRRRNQWLKRVSGLGCGTSRNRRDLESS
jgi:hypothetical protein